MPDPKKKLKLSNTLGDPKKRQNQATRQDSLDLYNKSKEVEQWYKENGYKPDKDNPVIEVSKALEDNDFYYKTYQGAGRRVDKGFFESENVPKSEYRKTVDKNKYFQRENADTWLNTDSPMQLYDKRIQPRNSKVFMRGDDAVSIRSYNNISNKPFDLLTPKEKELRVKQYGRAGVPNSYQSSIIKKPNTTTGNKVKEKGNKGMVLNETLTPKEKPIIVNSKNDPRYKAYQDSLTLSNISEKSLNLMNTKVNPLLKQNKTKEAYKYWKEEMKDTPQVDKAWENLKKLNKTPPKGKMIESIYNKEFGVNMFKKPTQPVEIEKIIERPKDTVVKSNIKPADVKERTISVELPKIYQQAKKADYFKITDKVNKNIGSSETTYKYRPESDGDLKEISKEKYSNGTPLNTRKVEAVYKKKKLSNKLGL